MDTSNHTGKGTSRVYWLTPIGSRLAAYLDYCDSSHVTTDIQFGDVRPPVPPEHHDDDRPETEKQRLERELEKALSNLHEWQGMSHDEFAAARDRVKALRAQIYVLENPPVGPDPLPDDDMDEERWKGLDEQDMFYQDPDYDSDDGGYDDSEDDEPEEE